MRRPSLLAAAVLAAWACAAGFPASAQQQEAGAGASRVEVVLSVAHKERLASIKEEFARAGMPNVHIQFVRRGQPPQNLGLGRDVPAETAREAIRLALKYNLGIGVLLPERLFPPRFITIASSNFDDTVESSIDEAALSQLRQPELTTNEFHRLYRGFTSVPRALPGRY
ncbi:MAG TPA: hypothetical protein VFS39_18135 [Nitrospira sp.]|nr:hypothetical protein [Nitrospira sp.]